MSEPEPFIRKDHGPEEKPVLKEQPPVKPLGKPEPPAPPLVPQDPALDEGDDPQDAFEDSALVEPPVEETATSPQGKDVEEKILTDEEVRRRLLSKPVIGPDQLNQKGSSPSSGGAQSPKAPPPPGVQRTASKGHHKSAMRPANLRTSSSSEMEKRKGGPKPPPLPKRSEPREEKETSAKSPILAVVSLFLFIGIVCLLILGAIRFLMNNEEEGAPVAEAVDESAPVAAVETPEEEEESLSPLQRVRRMQARALERVIDVTGPLDAAVEEAPIPGQRPEAPQQARREPSRRSFSQPTASALSEPPPPEHIEAVRAFIDDLLINMVGGKYENTRIFIGGVAYKSGELINEDLGLRFVGYDMEQGDLVFEDSYGARYLKRN